MVRASSPADLLSVVPYLLGFQPQESLVMLVLASGRVAMTARVDLPEPESGLNADAAGPVCAHLHAVAQQHAAEEVVLMAFTTDPVPGAQVLAVAEGVFGPLVASAWVSDAQRFCAVQDGLLGRWQAYEPSESAAVASAVYEGLSVLPSRHDLAERVAPDAARQARITDLLASAEVPNPSDAADRMTTLIGDYAGRRELGDAEIGELLLLCRTIPVRDQAWTAMTRQRADHAVHLWGQVARAAPESESAAAISLMGMAAWLSGDGALMLCCADRVADEHPTYSMGQLLYEIAANAVHPKEWEVMRGRC